MNSILKKVAIGTALAATALGTALPAQAQRYGGYRGGGYHHRGGDATGAAIIGGIVGLGVGAAIASSNNDRRYDRRGYYDEPYNNGYYRDGYYNDGYNNGYYNRPQYRGGDCYAQRRWDPYYRQWVRVRVCR